MKKTKIIALILALAMALSLVACGGGNNNNTSSPDDTNNDQGLVYAEGTTLRMATGYNSTDTGITFSAAIAGSGVTLADGKTYYNGNLKPTWVELQKVLNVQFEDKYQGKSAKDEWGYWKDQLDKVDMVSGTATLLNEAGAADQVVDIAQYLDKMPNFKKYLEDNPIVRLSVTGNTNNGAIYSSPYFDGVNDIERMPLMRADLVEKLLDGDEFKGANRAVNTTYYKPYMPTTSTVTVESLTADGSAKQNITKDYSKYGNIIEKMNAVEGLTGDQAVAMLRAYIDATYGETYAKRSDLFLGYDACWDADEMVALLRCAVASLNDTDGKAIAGLYSRETGNTQRQVDLFRFAGTLFGVRGLESRQDYLWIDSEGNLRDARQDADTYEAMERMNALYKEGLVVAEASRGGNFTTSDNYLEKDAGLMSYDYNQTQTVYNLTKLNEGEKYIAVMVPVARWNDGEVKYMRFTESWRSVKTDGWAISKAGVAGNQDKLYAALALIDYAYSEKGQILMSYGPDAFIKTKEDGSYETFNFNGKQMPVIADATYTELWKKAKGNYTNYARQYLGSTLSFVKSQAFEYQCTHEVGKEGAAKISVAIELGTIKHPELAITENPWYTSVPTTLPTTDEENTLINSLSELGSSSKFSQSKKEYNVLIDLIINGYALTEVPKFTSRDACVLTVSGTEEGQWGGKTYLETKTKAWLRLKAYYAYITK